MEAESEKMSALKRAYADIILNTAKESAARILASERRALSFQQSLFAAKEEALATMLRLKSLMDSKIKEAEMISSNQAKRIQELEVQLSEAEHTIVSLREELERVNNELKTKKHDLSEPLHEQRENGHAALDDGRCKASQLPSASNLQMVRPGNLSTINIIGATSGQRNAVSTGCFIESKAKDESLKHLLAERECGGNPDLASIIMRSKEPELYRNGCTQRIRAFEHNVLTVKLPNEQLDGQPPDSVNECNVYENGKFERSHSIDSDKAVKTVARKARNSRDSETYVQSVCESGLAIKFFRRFSPRKPRTKCIYVKPTDSAISHNRESRGHQPSPLGSSETKSGMTLETKSISEGPPPKLMKSHSAPIPSIHGGKSTEDRSLSSKIISGNEILGLSPCNNGTISEQFVLKQDCLDSRNENSDDLPCNQESVEHRNGVEEQILSSTERKDGILLNGTKYNSEVKFLKIDDSKLTTADQNVAQNSDVLDMKNDFSAMHSNSNAEMAYESSEALPQAEKDKFLKYTFQRTRKKGSSSSNNESIVPARINGKRKSGDKQNVLPEPSKAPSAADLPRNDRRLMQVARQLISLSEKRW